MNRFRIALIAAGMASAVSLNALTLEVQRFQDGQPLPAGYQEIPLGIDPAQVIYVSEEPFVDYLIPTNSGAAGIAAQKDGGQYIVSSNVDTFGGANNLTAPDRWHVVFEWEDGTPLPFGADFYGVAWAGWSNTDVAELQTRIDLATDQEVTVFHWFNDGWNYAGGGHTVLTGHELTVTQYTAGGAVVDSKQVTIPSGEATSFFGDHRMFASSIIKATRTAAGDYLIITNRGGNVGYKGTAVALMEDGGGDDGLVVPGIGALTFVPADPGDPAPVTGNTKLLNPDGTLSDAAWSGPSDTNPGATEPLWRDRVTWGGKAPEMPHFFTAGNGNLAILPMLNTTASVPQGSYRVYVVYTADRRPLQSEWTPDVGDAAGNVAAALEGGEFTAFDARTGAFTGLFGAEINTQLGYDFNMWGVFVGYVGLAADTNTISVDIAPFLGAVPGGNYRPSYHGIAYMPTDAAPGPGIFNRYDLVNGWVDTGKWMGWVYTEHYPWVWPARLGKYIYAGSGNWFYLPR